MIDRGGDAPDGLGAEQRLSALGRVMGELVHDLSNELTVLHGWALLARGEMDAGRTATPEMDHVVEMTSTLGTMLRDVLDTASGRALSSEVSFNPGAVTEEAVIRRAREMSDVTLRLKVGLPPEVRVAGRATFWARVVANLMGNAARHARREILVSLEGGVDDGRPVVVLRVEDDGSGIAPSERDSIFRPFWKGEGGSTGLGLSSVLWSVAELGGEVFYRDDSVLGGAAFEARIPIATPPVEKRRGPPTFPQGSEALWAKRILLIDDNSFVRNALVRLLGRAGADARALDPIGEPEERLWDSIVSAVPDVVLLDLRLGERDGIALWRQMCLDMPEVAASVIFMSGAAPGEPDWEAALLTGQPILAKPFELHELAAVVNRLRTGG